MSPTDVRVIQALGGGVASTIGLIYTLISLIGRGRIRFARGAI